jgi:capsular exopolysaccharide synthesis family protein
MMATPQAPRPGEGMHLRDLWRFLQRNRFLALGIPALTVLLTVAFVQRATPIYEAETLLRVDERRPTPDLARDAVRALALGGGSSIATELAVLRTRSLAEDVVDSLSLHTHVVSPRRVPRSELFEQLSTARTAPEGQYRLERVDGGFRIPARTAPAGAAPGGAPGAAPGAVAAGQVVRPGETVSLPGIVLILAPGALAHAAIELEVERFPVAVTRFRGTAGVEQPAREADVLAITYEAADPVLARDVVALMADRFIARRQQAKSAEARGTVRFLDDQITDVSGQLLVTENAIRTFREANRTISVEAEARADVERLAMLQAEREAAAAERAALGRSLERSTAEEGGTARRLMYFPTLLRSAAAAEMMASLTNLESRRAELLERRTPDDPEVLALTERIQELEAELSGSALAYLQGLTHQVEAYDRALAAFRSELDAVPARHIQMARLTREAGLLEEIYLLLEMRRKEAEIAAAVPDPSVHVVDPAVVPHEPVRPRKFLSVLMAGLLGTVLGLGMAFAREQMDTRVRTREDLRTASGDLPVLGTIPRMAPVGQRRVIRVLGRRNGARLDTGEPLLTGTDPHSPVSEAYRALRTNITFTRTERPARTMVFTSAMAGDGKSTSASNLAITLARQGLQSVLVDGDLRRGSLHTLFGVPREAGLSDVLLGRASLEEVVRVVDPEQSDSPLRFIPAGAPPMNPAELLGSEAMRAVLADLVDRYDTVIIDAPPLNLVTDAAVLGTRADGVILVARSGATDRDALAHALAQLEAVGATVLGTVLNDVDVRTERYSGGSYAAAGSYTGDR